MKQADHNHRELTSTKKVAAEGRPSMLESVAPMGSTAHELRHDAKDVSSTMYHHSLEVKHTSVQAALSMLWALHVFDEYRRLVQKRQEHGRT